MDTSLNHDSPNNAYVLALVFSLASPYGTPTVLSSYEFSTYPQGAPNGGTYSILAPRFDDVEFNHVYRCWNLLRQQRD